MKYTREKQLEYDMNFKDCTNPQATFDETSKCGVIAEMLGYKNVLRYDPIIQRCAISLLNYVLLENCLNRKQYHGQDYKLFYYQKQP
jgi:hypothetical protein